MSGLSEKDFVDWFRVLRGFLVEADTLLDDFQKKSDFYASKLKNIDFTNPEDLKGLSGIINNDKMPVFLSFLGELVSFASVMEKFQSGTDKNDYDKMRDQIKNLIGNIDKLLEGI